MKKEEFIQTVKEEMIKAMGTEFAVSTEPILKNNGVERTGLLIRKKEENVSPTVYLDEYYEQYLEHKDLKRIIKQIEQQYENYCVPAGIDMNFYSDFQRVKDRICYKLISAKGNEKLLEEVPYVEFLDLAICFYYSYEGDLPGLGAILVRNSHMMLWNVSTEELMHYAKENTSRLFPAVLESMAKIMQGYLEERNVDNPEAEAFIPEVPDMDMYVLSNSVKFLGAACILYTDLLSDTAKQFQTGLYILPSSVHETILLKDDGNYNPAWLKQMVESVNEFELDPQDVLSNNLYYYDLKEGKIRIMDME